MSLEAEFNQLWASYPRKVGKLAAFREFAKARSHASLSDIMTGVEAYKRRKPDYCDWCHLRTFLSQGRWMDEDDAPVQVAPRHECEHYPRCNSKEWCKTLLWREAQGWKRNPETGEWSKVS